MFLRIHEDDALALLKAFLKLPVKFKNLKFETDVVRLHISYGIVPLKVSLSLLSVEEFLLKFDIKGALGEIAKFLPMNGKGWKLVRGKLYIQTDEVVDGVKIRVNYLKIHEGFLEGEFSFII